MIREPLVIIEEWITRAHRNAMATHQIHFWNARDVMEGKVKVPDSRRVEAIAFITENCKDSPDRVSVVRALEGA